MAAFRVHAYHSVVEEEACQEAYQEEALAQEAFQEAAWGAS